MDPCKRWTAVAVLAWAVELAFLSPRRAEADGPVLERLRAEYPRASARLREAYSKVKAAGTLRTRPDSPGRLIRIAILGDLKKATLSNSRGAPGKGEVPAVEHVYCLGRTTAFKLHRNPAESDDYVLDGVSRVGVEPIEALERTRRHFQHFAGRFLFAPFEPSSISIDRLLNYKNYKIKSCDSKGRGVDEVVAVRYVYLNDNGRSVPIESGLVEFLPGRLWAIRRHELNSFATIRARGQERKVKFDQTMTVEYADDRGGVPVPKRVRYVSQEGEATLEFDTIELGETTPEREFTLAWYGLPDVTAPPADPARSHAAYWLFGLALLAIAAAVAIRMRGH